MGGVPRPLPVIPSQAEPAPAKAGEPRGLAGRGPFPLRGKVGMGVSPGGVPRERARAPLLQLHPAREHANNNHRRQHEPAHGGQEQRCVDPLLGRDHRRAVALQRRPQQRHGGHQPQVRHQVRRVLDRRDPPRQRRQAPHGNGHGQQRRAPHHQLVPERGGPGGQPETGEEQGEPHGPAPKHNNKDDK